MHNYFMSELWFGIVHAFDMTGLAVINIHMGVAESVANTCSQRACNEVKSNKIAHL